MCDVSLEVEAKLCGFPICRILCKLGLGIGAEGLQLCNVWLFIERLAALSYLILDRCLTALFDKTRSWLFGFYFLRDKVVVRRYGSPALKIMAVDNRAHLRVDFSMLLMKVHSRRKTIADYDTYCFIWFRYSISCFKDLNQRRLAQL